MKNVLLISALLFLSVHSFAQIRQPIVIETKNTAIVLTVAANQRLLQSYIGKKLAASDYAQMNGGREVYLTAGMENQFESAVRMIHTDGNPSLELRYISHKVTDTVNCQKTEIILKDPAYPVEVRLYYMSYFNEDVIKSWTEIIHQEKKNVLLTQYASSMLHFNADEYWLTQFHGDWAREMNMLEEKLTNGVKSIESKLGARTNFYQTQVFFVSMN
ncbi:MAG TPA: glycoside hydrolase family 36 N-terminal domain-containing protein, partial [Lacibacter sp.]|nr:glycoside hydrolase family 36 N-terminal domain-containing protein [Lacibacter sp.]